MRLFYNQSMVWWVNWSTVLISTRCADLLVSANRALWQVSHEFIVQRTRALQLVSMMRTVPNLHCSFIADGFVLQSRQALTDARQAAVGALGQMEWEEHQDGVGGHCNHILWDGSSLSTRMQSILESRATADVVVIDGITEGPGVKTGGAGKAVPWAKLVEWSMAVSAKLVVVTACDGVAFLRSVKSAPAYLQQCSFVQCNSGNDATALFTGPDLSLLLTCGKLCDDYAPWLLGGLYSMKYGCHKLQSHQALAAEALRRVRCQLLEGAKWYATHSQFDLDLRQTAISSVDLWSEMNLAVDSTDTWGTPSIREAAQGSLYFPMFQQRSRSARLRALAMESGGELPSAPVVNEAQPKLLTRRTSMPSDVQSLKRRKQESVGCHGK